MDVTEQSAQVGALLRRRPLEVGVGVVVAVLLVDLVLGIGTGRYAGATVGTYLWNGVVTGLVIGIAGIGLSMTYSILNFANFSHGDLVTTGAFTGWMAAFLVAGLGRLPLDELLLVGGRKGVNVRDLGISVTSTPVAVLVGLLAAAVGTIVVALLVDRVVFRPMRDQGSIPLLIASIGVALALRYLIVFVFQTGGRGLTAADRIPSFDVRIGSGAVNVDAHELTLVVSALVLMLGLHLLLRRTKLGKSMRAMADNQDLARVTGIPTERVIRYTWIIGGGLTGMSGFLVALERGTIAFNLGWALLLLIFAAVILGGIGSIYGAMIGGLVIGISSSLSLVWIPSQFATAAAFVVMILVLLLKPEGLFGGVTTA